MIEELINLIESQQTTVEQLSAALKHILHLLSATTGYISILLKRKHAITQSNPDGFVSEIAVSEGKLSKTTNLQTSDDLNIIKNKCCIPLHYRSEIVGHIYVITKDEIIKSAIVKYNPHFKLIGMIIYYDRINNERQDLLDRVEITKTKSMFMANVSHEIRTPLNSILGSLDYFAELNLTRSGEDVLNVMKHSCYNLLYLVNDILDISGLESGKMNIHLAPTKLSELIDGAYRVTKDSCNKAVTFHQTIDSDIPTSIITDPQRVKQIIINLMSNAFKFTESGHVKLRVTRATQDDLKELDLPPIVEVSMTPKQTSNELTSHYVYRKNSIIPEKRGSKQYVKISISDTGIGIKESDINKLFKSFSQIDSSTTKRYGGTGLGLAISSGFCKLLQGNISLISEWKKGSTFYFVIPIQEYRDHESEPQDLTILVGKQVLIVDDKVDNIVRLTQILDKYRMEYTTSTSARHAIASFINNPRKYKFDLGLIDVYMPEMDGNELAEYISKIDEPFPLIALSSAENKLNDITGNFDVTLLKPYYEEQVIKNIYNILKTKKTKTNSPKKSNPDKTQTSDTKSTSGKSSGSRSSSESKKKSPKKKSSHKSKHKNTIHKHSTSSPDDYFGERKLSDDFHANTNIKIKILIVEDNEYNQFTIKRMLNSLGYYNIDIANSGQDGIDKVKKNCDIQLEQSEGGTFTSKSKYDVILMDLVMPGMDGIHASRNIKKLFSDKKLCPQIIAVTADIITNDPESCMREGKMDGFIEKPIDKNILAEKLSSFV